MVNIDLQHCSIAVAVAFLTLIAFPKLRGILIKHVPWLSLNPEYHKVTSDKTSLDYRSTTKLSEERTVQVESSFPADWWSSVSTYQLERRAIFSKGWHFTTHKSHFRKAGDYLTLSIGGFSIFLTLGKDQKLRGFHNVCRHRAYEVTRKECGSTLMFGCRYHGWSYNTTGKLVKAPEFDGVEGFKKEENGLWEIGVVVGGSGAVWVCLETAVETHDLETYMDDAKLQRWGLRAAEKAFECKVQGNFNWKLASGYELPSLMKSAGNPSTLGKFAALFDVKTVYIPLSCAASIYSVNRGTSWITVALAPQSPTTTIVSVIIYQRPSIVSLKGNSTSHEIEHMIRRDLSDLEKMQVQLDEGAQTLFEGQIQSHSEMHELLKSHRRLERLEGREVQPAARNGYESLKDGSDDDFCRKLDRNARQGKMGPSLGDGLDW